MGSEIGKMFDGGCTIQTEHIEGLLKVSVSGEITFREREQLTTIIRKLALSHGATEIKIDLRDCPFIDSSAIVFLLAMYRLFESKITVVVTQGLQPEAIIKRTNVAQFLNLISTP